MKDHSTTELTSRCHTCPSRGAMLVPEGTGRFPVAFVGDHVELDNEYQVPGKIQHALAGPYGSMLARQLTRFGWRWTDFYTLTACFCAPRRAELRAAALGCDRFDTAVAALAPKVFITLGELAFERLTGLKVSPLLARGYIWPTRAPYTGWVVAALPPAYYAQDPGMLLTWIDDVTKAVRLAALDVPFEYPRVTAISDPPLHIWEGLVADFLVDPTRPLGVDTEYPYKRRADMSEEEKGAEVDLTHRIDEVNLSWDAGVGISVRWDGPYREGVLKILHASQQHGTSLFWNATADTGRLTASGGPVFRATHTVDLMDMFRCWRNCVRRKLAVAAPLWPSTWNVKPWKHLGTGDPVYRAMDAAVLVSGYADMSAALAAEGTSAGWDFLFRRLDPLLEGMTEAGLGVDGPKVAALAADVEARQTAMAQEMTRIVPPEVRPLKVWKGLAAAEKALAAAVAAAEVPPDATLERVGGARKAKRCGVCGAEGVTAAHTKKYLPPIPVDTAAAPL